MALPKITKQSRHSANCIHYIATGHYDLKQGRLNLPHTTRGDKSIKVRNYKLQGILCPDDPHKASVLFGRYNRVGNPKYHHYLGRPIECTNVVISFGRELDWRKPMDLARGVGIIHRFAYVQFRGHAVYTGYQMDTSGKIPSAHVHMCVGEFNMVTGYALNHNAYHTPNVIKTFDQVIIADNKRHIKQLTVIGRYGGHGWKSHRDIQPSLTERRLLPKVNLMLRSRLATNDKQLVQMMRPLGVTVEVHHRGDVRKTKRHPDRKPYAHDCMMMRIPGDHGTNGYMSMGHLRWFTKWSPNVDLLYMPRTRRVMYALNRQHIKQTPELSQEIEPQLMPVVKDKKKSGDAVGLYKRAVAVNQKHGNDIINAQSVRAMQRAIVIYEAERGKKGLSQHGFDYVVDYLYGSAKRYDSPNAKRAMRIEKQYPKYAKKRNARVDAINEQHDEQKTGQQNEQHRQQSRDDDISRG